MISPIQFKLSPLGLLIALAVAIGLLSGCAADQAQPDSLAEQAPAAPADPAPLVEQAPAASSAPEAQPRLPEPCALLTQADLVNGLAEPFQAGEAGELATGADAPFTPKNCAFQSGDKQVVLTLIPSSSPYQEQKEIATLTHALERVAGLGDEAFWETDSSELWVVQGQRTVVLGMYFTETSADVAKPLMQQILGRMQ